MATTVLEFKIAPYFGGTATFDGAVTPAAVVPTKVFVRATSGGQATPSASGYTLASVTGWLYSTSATEALVGSFYWHCEDADSATIADGYIHIDADDTGTYRGAADEASAFSGRKASTRTKTSATETTLVEVLS